MVRFAITALFLLSGAASFGWGEKYLLNHEVAWWLRLGVILLPWLVFTVYLLVYRRIWRPDELESLIGYKALAFAFYGLAFGLVVVSQLQTAGFMPGFEWTCDRLLLVMFGLLLLGSAWSKLSYR